MLDLRFFIGYDSKEPVAYHVLSHSILTRASKPVSITPLRQDTLRDASIYTRERGPTESTEFSLTRFLVPYLSDYQGWSVFMDSDMLCRCDLPAAVQFWIHRMSWRFRFDKQTNVSTEQAPSVLCCQHDYTPAEGVKFLGNIQTVYPRKNWSSFMIFNNEMCRALTPEYVNSATGLQLHRFQWTEDTKIGALPLEFNWLVGEYEKTEDLDPKILHWTLGGPWFEEYQNADFAHLWFAEREAAMGSVVSA